MLHIGAVLLDVLAQFLSNLAVAGEQVFTGHASLTGSTTGRNDILRIGESLLGVGGGGNLHVTETALAHFLSHTFR